MGTGAKIRRVRDVQWKGVQIALVSLLTLLGAASLGAGCGGGSSLTNGEEAFLAVMRTKFRITHDRLDDALLEDGRNVCRKLEVFPLRVLVNTASLDPDVYTVERDLTIIGTAIPTLCPEHEWQIDALAG